MTRYRTILHPTDFQDKSVEAFQVACEMARQNEADLVLLHVAPKGVVKYLDKVSERDASQTHEKLWSALRKKQTDEDDLKVTHRLEEGSPATVIRRIAHEVDADLLVIGPSNTAAVPLCWWTATTFDELVHQAPCSVLVAKGKEPSASTNEQLLAVVSDAAASSNSLPFLP